ncbi:carboxypeptidase-like regulatory domain-containing protein [Bacteroides sp. K03]|nr:carboxypeptidase-like regulatory domain-containing protein [Bacteroides sp. K03]
MLKYMKLLYKKLILLFLLVFAASQSFAQLKGVITDSITHEPLMYISVYYEGKGVGGVSNANGEYQIETRKNWNEVTFSSIGYRTKVIKLTPGQKVLDVQMVPDDVMLSEVVVKPKKEKYSKKNNPAVDFMRKVIEHKKAQKLEVNDYYQYDQYEKMKMSLNDITPEKLEKGIYKKYSFLKDQIEVSETTNSLILPISIQETSSQTVFRKSPESKKTIIKGMNSNGINEFFSTGDMLGTVLQDVFTNVNIYDDDIRLLQRRFTSPIAKEGLNFYKYYLMDTLTVERDTCVHLTFVPQNSQDFGFTGHLYVLKDSTYAVKKCVMNLPKKTGVNFVNQLDIVQQYEQLPNGNWVLMDDDMLVDLSLVKSMGGLQVQRTTKYSNYKFDPIEQRLFRLKGSVIKEADMLSKSDEYWAEVRQVPLTKTESSMDVFMNRIEQIPGFKYIIFGAKALIENFVETTGPKKPSKVDIGPINTMISNNYVDGLRLRLSAMTTANLNPHWFLSGYGAYGFKDHRWKYSGTLTYSFNKRDYVVWEFPKHFISATYSYDVMSPMDKFLFTDKDNVFVSFKTTTVDQMSYMRDVAINYELETPTGFGVKSMLRHRNDEPTGNLKYWANNSSADKMPLPNEKPIHDITTAEASVTLRYAPGEAFVNSKQRRIPVSLDAPIFTLTHTAGFKGVLGGEYNFNRTEASIWKRVWLPSSWGKVDISLKGGVEWNTVPFPLLILPEANLSYITQRETFCLINNMEFLNDRFASLSLSYDMNGKLFNRIPLLKKLKWREMIRFRTLWGTLTDKNNPFKSNNPDLFLFPMRDGQYTSHVMDPKIPYMEASIGVYNIFKLLHVEYVHRLTYRDNPGINKWGIRFMVLMVF